MDLQILILIFAEVLGLYGASSFRPWARLAKADFEHLLGLIVALIMNTKATSSGVAVSASSF